ncbi:TIGR03808 family TAT-translocated repetitive protein [Mesorhizobium sp. ZC-5]|uniref:TIGR03808 family TAT-translocated repetitive protein n=1 Tax=Mesorhizobium sp. ZC-5 TaxID=2986066 RepID=UPI0021E93DC3|nr:TIGR03808 family TAT-translocated repetitive protein [Mesorhizobium sp. ZC-5]MCV3239966.1 TIGR03808 family TAT-translocated repetitive protein [Mesorhizobium sp. ZC-5]
MLNRRRFLRQTAGFAVAGLTVPSAVHAANLPGIQAAAMRGSIDATDLGARPGALDDQSRIFARMLEKAGNQDMPLFLPPGTYVVSNLTLPRHLRLTGVPGATRIIYGGDGHLFAAEDAEHIELSGLVIDGANRWIGDHAQGLLDLRRVQHLVIDNCRIMGSGKNGISLERVSGRIERSEISGAADAGIYSVEAGKLQILTNMVSDCGNAGILAHRWQIADDGTMIFGNRIERILARAGGTGQNGNGINAFRANSVAIANNTIADCAFSAVRANSSSNIQIGGNSCMRSGETAIYAEFAFEGAVINANIVDGAANGISIVNMDSGGRMGVCSANIIRNLSTDGPYQPDPPGFGVGISVEADCAVTGNVIENAPRYGMNIGWGAFMRNVVATGNVIRKSGTGIGISVVEGTGSAVISDNVIDDAKNGAIIGHRWAKPATGDLASLEKSGFANLTVERNHVS